MTIAVANTANTNTFLFWLSITNQLASALSTAVVTTTANGTSAQTAGNAAISGTFAANIHLSNTFTVNTSGFIGNSTVNVSVNSTSLAIVNSTVDYVIIPPTTTQITNGGYFWNANGSFQLVQVSSPTTNNSVTTIGLSQQNVDQWAVASFHSAEYLINVFDNQANNHYTSKIILTHDTGQGYVTEFAQMQSNSVVGTFVANLQSGNAMLQFTPTSTSMVVRFARTLI